MNSTITGDLRLPTVLAGLVPTMRPTPGVETTTRAEERPAHTAHPDSPVGRTSRALAADPHATSPLRRLEARTGRRLLDPRQIADDELRALTDLLLGERYRRDARWHAPA